MTTRQERIAAQHKALGYFIEEAQADPSWLKERDRKQAPPTRSKESIVRACVAGALRPEEALELWKRVV